jgi:formylmethanofuran--tetrahydromethanopterin N-formyltransferase
MQLGPTRIEETFAEAFRMRYVRVVITAHDEYWAETAARSFTGFASSVIACDVEAGIERMLSVDETPDGRPGIACLLFGFSADALAKAIPTRAGQCLMTCATTAVFDGLADAAERIPLGRNLRFFGDGFQKSKVIGGRRYWRIPVMDGEFLVEESLGVEKGIGGGNLILQGRTAEGALSAARRAIDAIASSPGIIAPFPGGVVRSGSKVGSRYAKLPASTNEAYCPTLRGRVESQLDPEALVAYELVIDGEDEEAVSTAMAAAARAAAGPETLSIGALNFGGKLGKFHFHLREILAGPA